MHGNLQLWLAVPGAAQHFDPAQLTPDERDRLSRLRRPERRQEFAVSRALRAHVRRDSPEPASESLSHSGGYAALARAHPAVCVGVDLELHRPRAVLATARTAFSESEARALAAAASPERDRLFYAMWTVKEALAKALQLPLLEALRSCVLVIDGSEWQVRAATSAAGCVAVYQPRAELTLAVACIGGTVPIESWSWPPQRQATWPLIAAIALAGAGAHAVAGPGSAGAARAAAPA
jgi:phosphopantetheinyl transferase (holo-ACP synthase)